MADIRRYLDNEFALKRDRAIYEANRRKQELFTRIPELAQIDSELSLAGLRYAQALLNDTSKPLAEDYLLKMEQLNEKMTLILSSNNIPFNYLEPNFSCKICQDKGYVQSEGKTIPCSCYNKLYLEHLFKLSNLLDDSMSGFDYFDEKWYPDIIDNKKYLLEVSPRTQIREIKEQCSAFILNFPEKNTKNLYFYGLTGTGKTFMAKSIGLEIIKLGFSVLYLSSTTLFSLIQQYRLNIDREGISSEEAYKKMISTNLLILDDLGTEPQSDSKYAELLTLLERRIAQNRVRPTKTIIASNLNFKRLSQEYNERIASRIVGEFQSLQFVGDDIRILKKLKNMSSNNG